MPLHTRANATTMPMIAGLNAAGAGGEMKRNGRRASPPMSWLPPAMAMGFVPAARFLT